MHWKIVYGDNAYDFNADTDLTVGRMRQIKQWYGSELGRWSPFILALGQGDPDAWACAVWISRQKAGEQGVPEPRFMDFSLGEIMSRSEIIPGDEAGPTTDEPTPASTPTSENSEPATSSI